MKKTTVIHLLLLKQVNYSKAKFELDFVDFGAKRSRGGKFKNIEIELRKIISSKYYVADTKFAPAQFDFTSSRIQNRKRNFKKQATQYILNHEVIAQSSIHSLKILIDSIQKKKKVLFVNANPVLSPIIEEYVKSLKQHYSSWIPGLLTNRRFRGLGSAYSKKLKISKKASFLNYLLDYANLEKSMIEPLSLVVIFNAHENLAAFHEAIRMRIPTIAFSDARQNLAKPSQSFYPVIANTSPNFVYNYLALVRKYQ